MYNTTSMQIHATAIQKFADYMYNNICCIRCSYYVKVERSDTNLQVVCVQCFLANYLGGWVLILAVIDYIHTHTYNVVVKSTTLVYTDFQKLSCC